MASEVEICNRALSMVRGGSINTMDQIPATVASQQCRLWYDECRDTVLADAVWNFARRLTAPALLNQQVFNWRYVYAYPTDCLYINKIIPNIEVIEAGTAEDSASCMEYTHALERIIASMPEVNYQVYNNGTTKVLLCNEPNIRIDYRSRITDVNRMTTQFRAALSALLAANIAISIAGVTEGKALRQQALELYTGLISMANVNNSNEGKQEQPESDYILARL